MTKALPLQKRVRSLLDYDHETGIFCWLVHRSSTAQKWSVAGKKRTIGKKTYLRIQIDGKWFAAHRLAFVHMGVVCPDIVDHIDGDGLNNAWGNLRDAGYAGNAKNARRRSDNSSGVKNVYWCLQARRWQVNMQSDGRRYRRNFRTLDEATVFANGFREIIHGPYARAA